MRYILYISTVLFILVQVGRGDEQSRTFKLAFGEAKVIDVEVLTEKAEKGDTEARDELAYAYAKGYYGVEQSAEEASKWYGLIERDLVEAIEKEASGTNFFALACFYYRNASRFFEYKGSESHEWYGKAVTNYRKAAELGNLEAYVKLAMCYDWGGGVERDQSISLDWYQKAADLGYPPAEWKIGRFYETGTHGLEQDYTQAVVWYRKAAEHGDDNGQFDLAEMYNYGKGVEEDDAEAMKWYRKAAEQDYFSAYSSMGYHYYYGLGVSVDREEAVTWFKKDVENGTLADDISLFYLGHCYLYGVGTDRAEKEAVKLFKLAANPGFSDTGHASSQYYLGLCYESGMGVSIDYAEAVKWYRLAAEQGDEEAQFSVGMIYMNGQGVAQDFSEAEKWLRLASEQNHEVAQNNLGVMFAKRNEWKKAAEWYRKAAEQGYDIAQHNLADCYSDGKGVIEDDKVAVKWFRLAAYQGNDSSQNNLGVRYQYGSGVLEDYVEAYAWYLIAAMNGSELATTNKQKLKLILSAEQIAEGQKRARAILSKMDADKSGFPSESEQITSDIDIAPSGFGSGLLIKGGFVLTCWHVVDGAERISISAGGKDHVASVVQKDAANDIAILKVDDISDGVVINLSDDAQLGEKIFTLGYPHPDLQGSDVKFTTGSISSLTGIENNPRHYQISAAVQPGNSGGPLFDEKGNLVGIVAAKLDALLTLELTGDLPQNVNYAIKADYLKPLLKTVSGLEVGQEKMNDVNLLELIDELKQSVVMIKVY